jgi:preprotein translocase subunit YajC
VSSSIVILLVGFAVIWLLIVMPQRRRQKAHQDLIHQLAPGDYIITSGGLYGTVTEVGEDDLGLEIAPDVEVRISKRAIGGVVPPEEIEEVEIDDEGEEAADARVSEALRVPEDEATAPPIEEKRG